MIRPTSPLTLEEQVQWLIDRELIQDLLNLHARAIDEQNFVGLTDLFSDHGAMVIAGSRVKKNEIADFATPIFKHFQATHHVTSNTTIEIDGDRATATSYFHAVHRPSLECTAEHSYMGGVYRWTLHREHSTWLIELLEEEFTWLSGQNMTDYLVDAPLGVSAQTNLAQSPRASMAKPVLALVDYFFYMGPIEMLLDLAAGDFEYLFIFSMRSPWDAEAYNEFRERGLNVQLLEDVIREPHRIAHCSGITSIGDTTLRETSRIAANLGLTHYHSPDVADTISEKVLQRQALQNGGVPQPEWIEIDPSDSHWWQHIPPSLARGPMIVKPSRGWGSTGVTRVENLDDARVALDSAEGRWLLEAEISGGHHPLGSWLSDCVSVQTMTFDGETQLFGVMDKSPLAPPFRSTGDIVPSLLDPEVRRECERVALAAVRALGVQNGWSHTELKLSSDGPMVLEVNGRMTSTIHDASVRLYGSNPIRSWFDAALGIRPTIAGFDYDGRIVSQYTPPAPASAVSYDDVMRILPDLKELPFTFDVRLLRVESLSGGAETVATTTPISVWIEVDSAEALKKALETVKAILGTVGL
ncbi:nuclear transport factor 2 family protein [Rhodococcus sp. LB1]|uniref:nuclear transport factor 2 family protein n=1 Tax=Rhodococcus sp. LB1 TaxID=1807499 RepID=UPI00077A9557|nr:nuclear transport factor 2 family protein [Rhodococcus sp. LB1]KXX54214.1 hypothetical protein AZG88_25140 [Rhodococcus sp. LB1]